MSYKLLLVDDDQNVLDGLRRSLYKRYFMTTSDVPEKALEILEKEKDFSVIISDYKMPGMNGIEFLTKAMSIQPIATRILLTGQADQDVVMQAFHTVKIFKILTKPCPTDKLVETIENAIIEHNKLQYLQRSTAKKSLGDVLKDMQRQSLKFMNE